MSYVKILSIRLLASLVYTIRRRAITRAQNKWVVVTGSVGKTIMRQTLAGALIQTNQKVVSLKSNYVNELGVLCTLFLIDSFSVKSLRSWWALLTNAPVSETYLCIELGADFRTDISWFLKRFSPYAVFQTASCELDWTRVIQIVKVEREALKKAAVISYVLDDTSDIYATPVDATEVFLRYEKNELPEEITPFSLGRLMVRKYQNTEIIYDTYKVTPRCLMYSLICCLNAVPSQKVFLMTEMRPLLVEPAVLYESVLARLSQLDELYIVGDKLVFEYLKQHLRVSYLEMSEVNAWKQAIQERIVAGESLCVGIKVSAHYQLTTLREW